MELANTQYISRGWTHGEWAIPARDVDIRYGHGLLKKNSATWPEWMAVTTKRSFAVAEPFLSTKPAATAFVTSLDFEELNKLADGLPGGAQLVVGIGAGRALDAAKHVALKKDLPLVQAPTAVSTEAMVHGWYPRYKGSAINGVLEEWAYCDPDHVIADYDVILKSPRHLNVAGAGVVLSSYTAITEWRHAARRGVGPLNFEHVVMPVLRYQHHLARDFSVSINGKGELTPESVRLVLTALQQRDDHKLNHPAGVASDRPFAAALAMAGAGPYLYGEVVCLASLVVTWCTNEYEHHRVRVDNCKVRRRPTEIGISKEELRKTLAFVPEYFADKKVESVLRKEPVVGARFDALWEWLEAK